MLLFPQDFADPQELFVGIIACPDFINWDFEHFGIQTRSGHTSPPVNSQNAVCYNVMARIQPQK
jgi:hypothetical protein